ncbi:MAG: two-component regulator propeller domain-containing protein [Acidobacteriota bacterium]
MLQECETFVAHIRRANKSALAMVWFALMFPSVSSAQYRFDVWTTDNGLPQNSVYSILQTRDGYLWFTTFDGLARYDGVRFAIFNKANSAGINSNRFTTLFESSDGALWAGTEDGGVTRYKDGKFTTLTTQDGLPHNAVYSIQGEADGRILITTFSRMIYWQNGALTPVEGRNESVTGYQVYIGRSGTRWMFDSNRLYEHRAGVTRSYLLPVRTPGISFLCRYEDSGGNLWLGLFRDEALYRFRDGKFTRYSEKDGWLGVPAAICEDRQGNLWVGSDRLFLYRDGRFISFAEKEGFSGLSIKTILEDNEGNLWIGTGERGVNRATRQFITTFTRQHGMDSDNVYPILEDSRGDVWIGSDTLSRLRNDSFEKSAARWPRYVQSLCEDREGRLWVGTVGGLYRGRDGQFTDLSSSFPVPLTFDYIFAIHQSRDGAMWFGASTGLVRLKDDRFTVFTEKDGLAGNDVKVIFEDRRGALWIGTYGGLSRFDGDRFTSYTVRDGLASNRVRALFEDKDSALWIGTYDGGLSRFRDGRFVNYTSRDGLFSDGVFQIIEDGRGNFWMSSNQGIYRVSRDQLNQFAEGKIKAVTSTAYGKRDGMVSSECNGGRQPAGIKTRDGRLWFPTQQGVVVIDTAAVPFNPNPPPVVIEAALIDRKAVALSPSVRVEPGRGSLEIQYTGLSFVKPEQVRFKHKLEGLDEQWIDAGTRRYAYYSYLPPGNYIFKVIAANSDDVWNAEGAQIAIIVVPPFYRTWWFITATALAAVILAVAAYKMRVGQLRRAHAQQEAFSRELIQSQENERQRIAAELHDSLGQNLLVIKNRALMGLSQPQDRETVLAQMEEISSTVSETIEEVRGIAHNLRPSHLDRLGLTQALESMVEAVAASSSIRFSAEIDSIDGVFSKEAEINIYRIIQECLNNIVKHSSATRAEVAVRRMGESVHLVVRDDGRGFASDEATHRAGRGMGLRGMSERARMLGGTYQIQSAPGQGATVVVKIDLRGRDNGKK